MSYDKMAKRGTKQDFGSGQTSRSGRIARWVRRFGRLRGSGRARPDELSAGRMHLLLINVLFLPLMSSYLIGEFRIRTFDLRPASKGFFELLRIDPNV